MIQVIASLKVNLEEPAALQTYFDIALPLLEKVGARVAQRIDVGAPVAGTDAPEIVMVVEYPSYDAIDAVFQSTEYQSVIPARDKAFSKYNVCIVNNNQFLSQDPG